MRNYSDPYPSQDDIKTLAKKSHLTQKQVKIQFSRFRFKFGSSMLEGG